MPLSQQDYPELYVLGPEANKMLKDAPFGGPKIVFSRMQRAGVMQLLSQKCEYATLRRKGLGYDANALYVSTMLGDMPCCRGEVQKWPQTEKGLKSFLEAFRRDRWFGFLEKDIKVPR